MAHQVSVAYYTTSHGVTQQQTGVAAVYYGKVFKISKALNVRASDLIGEIEGQCAELQD